MNVTDIANMMIFLGSALCVGIGAVGSGLGEGLIGAKAMTALGKQQKANSELMQTMLISAAVTETGSIFCLVIGLVMIFSFVGLPAESIDYARALSFLGAGLAVGIGVVGPSVSAGLTGAEACAGVGRNPSDCNIITTNMLICQALTQTSAIFALIVSLLLLYLIPNQLEGISIPMQYAKGAAYLGAALGSGIVTIGSATGIGQITSKSIKYSSRFKENSGVFLRTMFVGTAVTETVTIYSLVIAFLLILR